MKRNIPSAVGLSSVLVIFAVLCLTVFALLSVSTVEADGRLAEKSRQTTAQYYAADCRAEQILAQLRGGTVPEGVTGENGHYRYHCAISDTQLLSVEVLVDKKNYEIIRWQAEPAVQWQTDETIYVFRPK